MQAHAAGAKFATVSGDLISHGFDCKYRTLFPHPAPDDYRTFVQKTLDYVIEELESSLPGVPVYVALGNNDSDCGDYRLNAHSEFLSVVGGEVAKGFPSTERQDAKETFAAGGYYSVTLPAPVRNTRLLVLNDLFMSSKYATCAGKPDPTAADAQLAWLQQQLTDARRNKETIWVMGHIPPGVDLHGTVTKRRDVCHGQSPEMFLSSEKMADEMVEFSDVVRLAIFAHTHMDEMHILASESAVQHPALGSGVAVKGVSSISPINGNAPSFTVARVQTSSAALVDYSVFSASNQTGVNTVWKEEYDYAKAYHEEAFTAAAVSKLIAGFKADPDANTKASQEYIRDFSPGGNSPLGLVWPQYVCSLSNNSAQGFSSCVCSAVK
jgi:sphingomyelin phosphodiesterase acid-like 3